MKQIVEALKTKKFVKDVEIKDLPAKVKELSTR
jgi:hypothetical protein